ncbi:hypothetical protein FB472_1844 [Rhodoglobus vestalii]|uniref:Uncharacterized protein n=1 Tax=Rhodoglobus vestalii TaxID=193384 RepID=A0A8H2PU89_9MICO|nr:hypothetical protein [Rhodoglobus vestalii]TQO20226.1 hypothetical protein FB472_1844 [Rhodoglobus vestalii]
MMAAGGWRAFLGTILYSVLERRLRVAIVLGGIVFALMLAGWVSIGLGLV